MPSAVESDGGKEDPVVPAATEPAPATEQAADAAPQKAKSKWSFTSKAKGTC